MTARSRGAIRIYSGIDTPAPRALTRAVVLAAALGLTVAGTAHPARAASESGQAARSGDVPGAGPNDWAACDAAGQQAEAAHQLPSGLLSAIGRVESGRSAPGTGRLAPWPWTINAAGRGQNFADRATALTATRALLQQGVGSIDVGCFQVNLAYHPDAFDTLESAFEPQANARAAARFLSALRGRTGTWDAAIAAYHSATPERGIPYRQRVMAAWGQPGLPADSASGPPASTEAAAVPMLRTVSWSPAAGGMQVWTPSGRNGAANIISMQAVPALPLVRTAASGNR